MFKILAKIFGSSNDRTLISYKSKLPEIHKFYEQFKYFKENEFEVKTNEFRKRIKEGALLESLIPEAFALVQVASENTLGMKHYDVQLIGGMVLHEGKVAEMATGEGKTLVATLPAYLNALTGNSVHIVTVNDYLAQRDAQTMQPLFDLLAMKCDFITSAIPPHERTEKYNSDILYITNNEIGFDYLRDNMRDSSVELTLTKHGLNFAIIDEIDSILIDESRTPLIISGPVQQLQDIYHLARDTVHSFTEDDYEIEEKNNSVYITDVGYQRIDTFLQKSGIIEKNESVYETHDLQTQIRNNHIIHSINQALKAHKTLKENTDYIIRNKLVMIIDEFTGRIMDGRRYSDGLHQAIEAKHKVEIQHESQTLASITYQNYFRMYKKLSGMTGTASTEASEFHEIYSLSVVLIPTHKPLIREDGDDFVYRTEKEKLDAIVDVVKESHQKGQPVLLGTTSVGKSEQLSALLKQHKLPHNVLNAKHHEKEAEIIADAGKLKAITIATNMAGRGTDIILGGSVDKIIAKKIRYIQDESRKKEIANNVKEGHAIDAQKVKDVGGLFVLASERHESRRIDNQLRGRSGRQGDIGKTQFFLSLEDDLLRIFGGEKLNSILKTFGFKEGESIQHPWLNRIILKSQGKIEAQHFEVRKNLIKYDDIMNTQRQIVYQKRMELINHQVSIDSHILNTINKVSSQEYLVSQGDSPEIKSLVLNEEGDSLSVKLTNKYNKMYSEAEDKSKARHFSIAILDSLWKEHLYTVDGLRHNMHLRSYAQKDPLNEYKIEVFQTFEALLNNYHTFLLKELLSK
ncbi:MAG: preprotein translocase subunit SecA [Candidatus Deianiraeaceae bacterium]|jgi:preprotein translocase subunit SecA